MSRQLAELGHRADPVPADRDDFAGWCKYWESVGVFTLAEVFGDDGGKGGEIEALMDRLDPDLLQTIRSEVGRGGKPVVGSWFAADHPDPPAEVMDLYRKTADWLGPVTPASNAPDGR